MFFRGVGRRSVNLLSAAALWRCRRGAEGWLRGGGPSPSLQLRGEQSCCLRKALESSAAFSFFTRTNYPVQLCCETGWCCWSRDGPGLLSSARAASAAVWILDQVSRSPFNLCAKEQSPGRGNGLLHSREFLLRHRLLEPQFRGNSFIFVWVLSFT